MSGAAEAFATVRQYAEKQGTEIADASETPSSVSARIPLTDFVVALEGAVALLGVGGTIELSLPADDPTVTLVSATPGLWREQSGSVAAALPSLAGTPPARWTTEVLASAKAEFVSAEAVVHLTKDDWKKQIEAETGWGAWLGLSLGGFANWLEASWKDVLMELFSHRAALVLIDDWDSPPLVLGRLVFGGLDYRPATAPDPDPEWPLPAPATQLRALDLRIDARMPQVIEARILEVAARNAAELLADSRDDQGLRPARLSATVWTFPEDQHEKPACRVNQVEAVVSLAKWVSQEPYFTRLSVGRRIAAERIADPLSGPPSRTVIDAADLSYVQVIDERVQAALQGQAELERSFLDMDGDVTRIRGSISGTLDDVLVRALTAALGIAVAALTAKEVRGWPTVAASAIVALYVLYVVSSQMQTLRSDMNERIDLFRDLVRGRNLSRIEEALGGVSGLGFNRPLYRREFSLGEDVVGKLEGWRSSISNRIRWARIALVALAVAIGGLGAVAGLLHYRSAGTPPPQIPTPSISSNAVQGSITLPFWGVHSLSSSEGAQAPDELRPLPG